MAQSDDDHTMVMLNGFGIDLISMRDEQPFTKDSLAAHKGRGVYVYIRVDDTDTLHKKLAASGIQPATEPKDWPWGNCEFIVKDPDGYKLCFWQPLTQ